jgi:uncharacterized membrane protein YkvA (DUF1232 family)
MPERDPFPRDETAALIRRLPAYGRLAWQLSRDPTIPTARRAAVIAAAVYLVSPVDVIPGIIPVVGQLDDLLIAVIALRFALRALPAPQRERHLIEARLSEATLAADEKAIADVAGWTVRTGLRVGITASRFGLQAGARASRGLGRAGLAGAKRLRTRSQPAP